MDNMIQVAMPNDLNHIRMIKMIENSINDNKNDINLVTKRTSDSVVQDWYSNITKNIQFIHDISIASNVYWIIMIDVSSTFYNESWVC